MTVQLQVAPQQQAVDLVVVDHQQVRGAVPDVSHREVP